MHAAVRRARFGALLAMIALLSACDFGYHVDPPIDGGAADARTADTALSDAGVGEAAR